MFYVLTNEGLVPENKVKAVQVVPVVPAEVVPEPTPPYALEVPVVQVPLAVPEIK